MLKRASDNAGASYSSVIHRPEQAFAPAFDLLKYLGMIRRRGPLVIAFGLFFGFLGALYALQLVPVYTSNATLLLDPSQSNNLSVDPSASTYGAYIDDGRIESELAILRSTDVAKRVAAQLTTPDEPVAESPPTFMAVLAGALKSLVVGSSRPAANEDLPADDPIERRAKQLQAAVNVSRVSFSYLISVGYTSPSPAFSAEVANGFADQYLVDQLETRYESTKRTNDWLNERLGDLRNKVRDSENAVETFKSENNIVETAGSTLSDQQVQKLNEQLVITRAETAQAKASFDQVQATAKRGSDVTSFADAAQASAIGQLRAKSSEVRRDLAEATVKYGERHPTVVALKAQLSDIERQIGNERARTIASAENQYRVALSRERSIEASLNEMKGGVTQANQAAVTLRELEREAQANKALYESFLSKFKETSQQETLKISNARIIERAKPPSSPSAPQKSRIALAGLALGLAIGGALAFLLEQLDHGFHGSKHVEAVLGIPVLASVPAADHEIHHGLFSRTFTRLNVFARFARKLRGQTGETRRKRQMRAKLSQLVTQKPLSPYTEAIRSLRMGIRFADVDKPRKTILISSALPGEGKSTIASNLAQHAATFGEKVVLVDMDLRHPAISEVYAPEASLGLVDVALGEAKLASVIQSDKATGLSILPAPCNNRLTHTAEVLGSKRVQEILKQLSDEYDLVVIDSSPLLPVTDGRMLIDSVDALVLVIKWEDTKRDAVESALDQCYGLPDKLIGVVLNRVVPSRARYYGRYKNNYYGNQYPYYDASKR